jgi:hypothetical protein
VSGTGTATISNAGTISGGKANGGGGAQADAIDLSGGGNSLLLKTTSIINGNVVSSSGTSNGGDTLNLGGAGSASLALSQYQGFATFIKSDVSNWTLTGNGSHNWSITNGTLTGTTASMAGNLAFNPADHATPGAVFNQSVAGSYGATISGRGSVGITGGGTVTFTGINTYTGGTNIGGGSTLTLVNGAAAGSGLVSIASGAALAGAGTVGNSIVNDGTVRDTGAGVTLSGSVSGTGQYAGSTTFTGILSRGTGQGVIRGDTMTFASDGELLLQGSGLSSYESLTAKTVTFQNGSSLDFSLNQAGLTAVEQALKSSHSLSFDLIDANFTGSGLPSFITDLSGLSGVTVREVLAALGNGYSELELQVSVSAVPLPASLPLFLSGLLGLFGLGAGKRCLQKRR